MRSPTKPTKAYKIRNKEGLYYNPNKEWSSAGKTWTKLNFLTCHLSYYIKSHGGVIPIDWEIVEFDLVESNSYKAHKMVKGAISSDEAIIKDVLI